MTVMFQAYDAYMELKGNLEEGTKFYNDLTQLLVTFQVPVKGVEEASKYSDPDVKYSLLMTC